VGLLRDQYRKRDYLDYLVFVLGPLVASVELLHGQDQKSNLERDLAKVLTVNY
jgi:hypothetical protein